MLAVRMRRSSIRCRESRSPIRCCESLLVGRPKLFLSAQPIGPTHPTKGVAPKPRSSLRRSVGPTHACQTAPSEHVDPPPPGLPHKLLLGTSSRQISNAYLGGILVWRLSYTLLLFAGTLGSGHSRLGALPQDSTPTTYYHTHQIRITFIVLVDVSVKLSFIN